MRYIVHYTFVTVTTLTFAFRRAYIRRDLSRAKSSVDAVILYVVSRFVRVQPSRSGDGGSSGRGPNGNFSYAARVRFAPISAVVVITSHA